MFQAEREIPRVEAFYHQLTGSEPKHGEQPYAPIPPEANAEAYVQDNLQRLYAALRGLGATSWSTVPGPVVQSFSPKVNVLESDKQWKCQVEMPGVEKSDLKVEIAEGNLRVAATRRISDGNGQRAIYVEAEPCRFERILPLPRFLEGESAEAKLENGVLNIAFDKDATGTRRDVQVEVA